MAIHQFETQALALEWIRTHKRAAHCLVSGQYYWVHPVGRIQARVPCDICMKDYGRAPEIGVARTICVDCHAKGHVLDFPKSRFVPRARARGLLPAEDPQKRNDWDEDDWSEECCP